MGRKIQELELLKTLDLKLIGYSLCGICNNVDREGREIKDKGIGHLSKGIRELKNLRYLSLNFSM